MDILRETLRRLWYLLNRRRMDDQLRQEMDAHRALMADPRHFGNPLRWELEARRVWRVAWFDGLARELRIAARSLARARGFTTVTVASLAFGFLLLTVTVVVTNAYLVRALPYGAADRLYHVQYAPPGPWEPRGLSAFDWSTVSDVVEFPILFGSETYYFSDAEFAQPARGVRASLDFVRGLEVQAAVGRTVRAQDFESEADPVMMLGYALWHERFGGDPAIIGRPLSVETESARGTRESLRVVGVLPAGFYFGRDSTDRVDLLVPARPASARAYMIRLRPGVPREAAEARLTAAVRSSASGIPSDWRGVTLEGVRDRYVAELRPIVVGVTAGAVFVLVLVCINVGVLTVLRGMRRQKELAVRAALGAPRWQAVRLLALESALLAAAALAIGVMTTHVLLPLISPVISVRLGRPAPGGLDALSIDPMVLLTVGATAAAVVLGLALLPLGAPWLDRLAPLMRQDRSNAVDTPRTRRIRSALLVLQVACTLLMVSAGGWMTRSVISMLQSDLGFDSSHLVRGRLVLPAAAGADPDGFFHVQEQFADAAAALTRSPVVFTTWPPFVDRPSQRVEGQAPDAAAASAGVIRVGASYFETLRVALQQGRAFDHDEIRSGSAVAIVSETLARRLWPGGHAVGQRVRTIEPTPDGARADAWRTVIGVSADVRQRYGDDELADLYLPRTAIDAGRFGTYYLRTEQDSGLLLRDLRSAAARLHRQAVVDPLRAVSDENEQLEGARFLATALRLVGLGALGLAALGIYGVTACTVQQRARETAIRLALGAPHGAIRRLLLRDFIGVIAIGVALGGAAAVPLGWVLATRFFGIGDVVFSTTMAACAVVVTVAMAAAWWPARRASLREPSAVLNEG